MVPSIFFGHSRQANTNKGIVLISAKVCIIRLSPIEKNLSGMPKATLVLQLNIYICFALYIMYLLPCDQDNLGKSC